jgi:hypothetical protein
MPSTGPAVVLTVLLAVGAAASAEEPESRSATERLIRALEQQSLTTIAAEYPQQPGRFAAALYIPGSQLLAISTRYPAPDRLRAMLASGDHREVYLELHTAGAREDRVFIEDLGADGLQRTRRGSDPFDVVWRDGTSQIVYDGKWARQEKSEAEYDAAYASDERAYVQLLAVLAAAVTAPPPATAATTAPTP